jgi:hypothetical protein
MSLYAGTMRARSRPALTALWIPDKIETYSQCNEMQASISVWA